VRPSAPGSALEFADLFGERACALEARAAPGTQAWRAPEEARLLFAALALEPAELAALEGAAPGALTPGPDPGWLVYSGPARALRALGGSHAGLSPLWAAWAAAARPRAEPRLMGIVNVTPDSFSDGGRHLAPEEAIAHGLKLIGEGADILDVGGESTRPGSEPVPTEIELERVLPVVRALAADGRALVSVDTRKAAVAEAALEAGATLVNDVSAGRDDERMLPLVAERGASIVLMHLCGTPRDMQERPHYTDVVREVAAHLRERAAAAWQAGIAPARIALDPGLGFGKRLEDNLALMRALPELRSLGLPLVLGASRKSFLGRLSGEERPEHRAHESSAAVALGAWLGADVQRVHDVGAARAALAVARGVSELAPDARSA